MSAKPRVLFSREEQKCWAGDSVHCKKLRALKSGLNFEFIFFALPFILLLITWQLFLQPPTLPD